LKGGPRHKFSNLVSLPCPFSGKRGEKEGFLTKTTFLKGHKFSSGKPCIFSKIPFLLGKPKVCIFSKNG